MNIKTIRKGLEGAMRAYFEKNGILVDADFNLLEPVVEWTGVVSIDGIHKHNYRLYTVGVHRDTALKMTKQMYPNAASIQLNYAYEEKNYYAFPLNSKDHLPESSQALIFNNVSQKLNSGGYINGTMPLYSITRLVV